MGLWQSALRIEVRIVGTPIIIFYFERRPRQMKETRILVTDYILNARIHMLRKEREIALTLNNSLEIILYS